MAKQQKKIFTENKSNLYNLNRPLYNLIVKYGFSHLYLAKQLYPSDWGKVEESTLTGRLRNKLDGRGIVTAAEHTNLINIFSEIEDHISKSIKEARAIKSQLRKDTIDKLLETLDKETLDELRDKL